MRCFTVLLWMCGASLEGLIILCQGKVLGSAMPNDTFAWINLPTLGLAGPAIQEQ